MNSTTILHVSAEVPTRIDGPGGMRDTVAYAADRDETGWFVAERIVSVWNAMAGIDDPELCMAESTALRASHERLRMALAECVTQLGTFPMGQMNNSDHEAVKFAREALAAIPLA